MGYYLLVDFGSTYTKLTCVDLVKEEIVATSKSITTVETNVLEGYESALELLFKNIGNKVDFLGITACSSAAGGLKMAAIGLVQELTVEAAKRACLGAGAKVELVISHHITNRNIKEIIDKKIDIILLAGGTDGGNSECILYNAEKLSQANLDIPIIVAGNKDCIDEIEDIFKGRINSYKICENVMPKVNVLNVDSAKVAIREFFIEKIIEAKGIKKAEEVIGEIIMPTPEAVLEAATLLSEGYGDNKGFGDIVLVDIGGATTDVHSIGSGDPTRLDCVYHGLPEPFSKRTVEGDLGMRYSALSLYNLENEKQLNNYLKDYLDTFNILDECTYRHNNINLVPSNEHEILFDEAIAKLCCDLSMSRHVGTITSVYTPMGQMYYQNGKDLSNVNYIIGTGGVLVHSKNPSPILKEVLIKQSKPFELRPKNAKFLLDKTYILSAMGILSKKYPNVALNIMKKYLVSID